MNLVAIGGGTGLATLLSGLKHYVGETPARSIGSGSSPGDEAEQLKQSATVATTAQGGKASPIISNLTAIVTVSDDGGSSGRLREEFQILPPGDIRNCMVALSEDEQLMSQLFRYRFKSKGDLRDHSFGNLFLTALTAVTGDFLEAVKLSSEVLAIKGRIYPATTADVGLTAQLADGTIVRGETNISRSKLPITKVELDPPSVLPLPETIAAIAEADLITIGPGSLFTSIIPNLLVKGIPEALSQSAATKVYVCNIMTQPGETVGFSAQDHLQSLFSYAPELSLDYIVVNSTLIPEDLRQKYEADGATQVGLRTCRESNQERSPIINQYTQKRSKLICSDLLEVRTIQVEEEKQVIRHDPEKLARLVVKLAASNQVQ